MNIQEALRFHLVERRTQLAREKGPMLAASTFGLDLKIGVDKLLRKLMRNYE